MTRLLVLGTAAAVTTADRDFTAVALEFDKELLVIDAGPNVFARLYRCGADPLALGNVVITHRHMDHLVGLAALLGQLCMAGRRAPVNVWGL